MTPLDRRSRLCFTLVPLLLTAGLAGCIGDSEDLEESSVDGFRVFLAASGQGPAKALLDSVELDVNGTAGDAPVSLEIEQARVDMGQLATEGKALLVASGPANGTATAVTLTFDYVDLGDQNLTDATVEVPVSFPVGPGLDGTVTLDLDASREEGQATFDNLVVEQDGQRVKAVTRSELDAPQRQDIPQLPSPSIVAFSDGGNNTGPSFLVNEEINFTYQLPSTNASIRNVFWAFGDDATATGEFVQHAYRTPGFYRVTLIVEGERGQQSTATTTLDAFHRSEGAGNVLLGTGGEAAVQDRDVKEHDLKIPGNFTSLSLKLVHGPSAGYCSEDITVKVNQTPGVGPVPPQPLPAEVNETAPTGGTCAPSNVIVEIENAAGEVLGRNAESSEVKWINITGLMNGGEWTLRVKGDEGAAVGYSYGVEAHYLGLCAEAGGPAALEGSGEDGCAGAPSPVGESGGTIPEP